MVDDLALLKREFDETRHRLIVTEQALTIAEQALEDIVVAHIRPSELAHAGDSVPQHARDALRTIHAVLKRIDHAVEQGS